MKLLLIDDKRAIPIDSLIYYDIKIFREIVIKIDLPEAIYGIRAKYGIIFLYRKEN